MILQTPILINLITFSLASRFPWRSWRSWVSLPASWFSGELVLASWWLIKSFDGFCSACGILQCADTNNYPMLWWTRQSRLYKEISNTNNNFVMMPIWNGHLTLLWSVHTMSYLYLISLGRFVLWQGNIQLRLLIHYAYLLLFSINKHIYSK
jgi:hypothetical protein